jgi:hypothetical protein
MHLINFPRLRIKKYPKGWVVEIQKKKWWGKKYWIHIESVSGIESQPWYFSSMEIAVEEASKHFKWDLFHGYAKHQND